MTAPRRRGACPSLTAPMETGDGLLLRLIPPAGGWGASGVAALADAAQSFGNGRLEVTARGNLQARGFTRETVAPFAQACADAGLVEGPPVVATGPLAGEDPNEAADPRPLAAAIAAALPVLGPKVSVLVEGGGALPLDRLVADIRLRAECGGWWHIWAGGRYLGLVSESRAADVVLRLLGRLADCGPAARMRDLASEDFGCDLIPAAAPLAVASEPIGLHRLRTGLGLGVGFAFGTVEATALSAFARAAGRARLRPAPGRALLALGLSEPEVLTLRGITADLGFITRPDDLRRRIVACPGAPFCGSAEGETRPLAARLVGRPDVLPPGVLHLSGCRKGCAHPGEAPVTLLAQPGGFGLILRGSARSAPVRRVQPADVEAALEAVA